MIIHTVWATRKHTPDEPELVEAWDEWSVDNNSEGFEEAIKKALASWGDDLGEVRRIRIGVTDREIFGAFSVPYVVGCVKQ